MLCRSLAIAICASSLTVSSAVAQSPVGDAVQGAVDGARRGAADAINQRVNDALGVPNTNNSNLTNPTTNPNANRNWVDQSLRPALSESDQGYQLNNQMNDRLRQAGFQPGDIILDQNGQPLRSNDSLDQMLNNYDGQLRVQRNGQTVQIQTQQRLNSTSQANQQSNQRRLGIHMQPTQGMVIVSRVDSNSLAAQTGFQPGDRILAINGQTVNDPRMVGQRISMNGNSRVVFLVERDGQPMELVANFDGAQRQAYHQGSFNNQDMMQRVDELEKRIAELESQHQQIMQEHNELMEQSNSNEPRTTTSTESDTHAEVEGPGPATNEQGQH